MFVQGGSQPCLQILKYQILILTFWRPLYYWNATKSLIYLHPLPKTNETPTDTFLTLVEGISPPMKFLVLSSIL